MKNILLLPALIIVLASCNSENKTADNNTSEQDSTFWKDCSYPIEQIGKGKTFIYKNADGTGEPIFEDLHLITEQGKQYITSRLYSSPFLIYDKSKYTTDGDSIIETYTYIQLHSRPFSPLPNPNSILDAPVVGGIHLHYDSNSPIKGEILKDTTIYNGKRVKATITKIAYTKDDSTLTYSADGEFLKDTIITWQGKQYNCIVITKKRTTEFSSKRYPDAKHTTYDTGDYYYAKGIGLILYTDKRNDHVTIMELTEIRDYSPSNIFK